jgi:hypothetical protein
MARRPRDYAAENRRRNELARQRGFTSRSAQRRAIERGEFPAVNPSRIRSERTRNAQASLASRPSSAPRGSTGSKSDRLHAAGFRSDYHYRQVRNENFDYDALHAHRQIAKYDPEVNAPGTDRYVYAMAYYQAFVSGPERYAVVRRSGGSEYLRRYLVDITHYYTANEYEVNYGGQE